MTDSESFESVSGDFLSDLESHQSISGKSAADAGGLGELVSSSTSGRVAESDAQAGQPVGSGDKLSKRGVPKVSFTRARRRVGRRPKHNKPDVKIKKVSVSEQN